MTIHTSGLFRLFSLVKWILLSIIAPPMCYACSKNLTRTEVGLCGSCKDAIKSVATFDLEITRTYFIPVFALSDYKDPLKKLVLAKSYSDLAASRVLGDLLWELGPLKNISFDYIVPIGLHWQRYAKRGYNQAHEMSVSLSHASGKPIAQILKRVKRTEFQFLLPFDQRADNLKEAFKIRSVHANQYEGTTLLIVDDVMTSGSTLKEAVNQLRTLKPKAIYAIVACRVI